MTVLNRIIYRDYFSVMSFVIGMISLVSLLLIVDLDVINSWGFFKQNNRDKREILKFCLGVLIIISTGKKKNSVHHAFKKKYTCLFWRRRGLNRI